MRHIKEPARPGRPCRFSKIFLQKPFSQAAALFQMNTGASTAIGTMAPAPANAFAGAGCLCAARSLTPAKASRPKAGRHAYKQGNNFPVISVLSISAERDGVKDDKNRPGVMHQNTHYRVQNACHGKEDSRKVQCHGKARFPPDGAHHFLRHLQQMRQLFEVFVHKGDSAAPAAISLPTPPMAMLICAFFSAWVHRSRRRLSCTSVCLLLAGAYPPCLFSGRQPA